MTTQGRVTVPLWRWNQRNNGPDPGMCQHAWRIRDVSAALPGTYVCEVCDRCGALRLDGPEAITGPPSHVSGRSHHPPRLLGATVTATPLALTALLCLVVPSRPRAVDGSRPSRRLGQPNALIDMNIDPSSTVWWWFGATLRTHHPGPREGRQRRDHPQARRGGVTPGSQSVVTVDVPGFGPTATMPPSAATSTPPGCPSTSASFDPADRVIWAFYSIRV